MDHKISLLMVRVLPNFKGFSLWKLKNSRYSPSDTIENATRSQNYLLLFLFDYWKPVRPSWCEHLPKFNYFVITGLKSEIWGNIWWTNWTFECILQLSALCKHSLLWSVIYKPRQTINILFLSMPPGVYPGTLAKVQFNQVSSDTLTWFPVIFFCFQKRCY